MGFLQPLEPRPASFFLFFLMQLFKDNMVWKHFYEKGLESIVIKQDM